MGILPYGQLYERVSRNYRSPKSKITEMIRNGEIFHIKRGWYADTRIAPEAAAMVLEPFAYISFQSALRSHGLIPEAVFNYTVASPMLRNKTVYSNCFGTFLFYPVPAAAAGEGLSVVAAGKETFFIASAEKALMDMVFRTRNITSVHEMILFLIEDMRIEEEDLINLDLPFIEKTAPLYNRNKEQLLVSALKKIRKSSYHD